MIGIDIVEIERIKNIYLKHGELFVDKILNNQERKELPSKKDMNFFKLLSCFIAAKEAVFKACSSENFDWKEISVFNLQKYPTVHIHRPKFNSKISLTCSVGGNLVLSQAISSYA